MSPTLHGRPPAGQEGWCRPMATAPGPSSVPAVPTETRPGAGDSLAGPGRASAHVVARVVALRHVHHADVPAGLGAVPEDAAAAAHLRAPVPRHARRDPRRRAERV